MTNFAKIDAVIITHVHPDHFDPDKLKQIVSENPDVKILTTAGVAEQLKRNTLTVETNKQYEIGDIQLEFFGEMHAQISETYPAAQNVGVLLNGRLFYPGDSFTECPKPYQTLAVPAMAPWLKFSQTEEYIKNSNASEIFPTHDWFINQDGQGLYDRLIGAACEASNKKYLPVRVGESLTV